MVSPTEEFTTGSLNIDYDHQEEAKDSGSDHSTGTDVLTLGSPTSRFISTRTSDRNTVRRWSSRRTNTEVSETSTTPTSSQRTTTEYPPPTNLGPVQNASPSHHMTTATTNAAYKTTASSTPTTNDAYDTTASETATSISKSLQIPTGVSPARPDHPRVNAATISGGVAGLLGLLILVLLVKVYVRQRKIIKERDILMMSMYLTPKQTPLKKHRFKYTASNEELKQEEDVTEQERDSYMEPLVHRQIWQLLDRSPVLPRRAEETENRKGTMYSSIRISENTAQRLQYIARCLGPNDALLKKQSITSLQTSLNDDYSQVKAPGAKRMELNDAPRWSTDTNHYEFVAGSTVDETEAEDTVIYDEVILEQTERLRYTKPPVGDNFNARMVRSRSTEVVSEECRGNHPKRLTTAARNSTIDIRGSVIDNVKPFTYKLVGEMKLITNEG